MARIDPDKEGQSSKDARADGRELLDLESILVRAASKEPLSPIDEHRLYADIERLFSSTHQMARLFSLPATSTTTR
ncbi:hypothetical protein SYNPS1DRAFT_25964, partial [Syncephalis pseudoplumigaleata]